MAVLVKHGVESRGIEPVPEEDRVELKWWIVVPQFTLWSAANTNILTFSAGTLGPALFGMDYTSSIWTIVVFGVLSALPVAYFATFGPLLGMRQMLQSRYSFGFWPALVPSFLNCLTLLGFLAINAILGGQTLSIASGSAMSWNVGIVVVGIISLILSFMGLRALHFYSMGMFPVILILYFVIVGLTADKLYLAKEVSKEIVVSRGQILSFGATLIGFTVPYATLASDFTTYLPPRVNKIFLFMMVFLGLLIPIVCIQIFGAIVALAAQAIPEWSDASLISVPNLIFTLVGAGNAGRFVMVLMALSVTANTAPTIYSCGLSAMVVLPFLVRIPRYFLAIAVTAIYIPLSIVGSTHFYTALSNLLAILSYWFALFLPPVILEPLVFRRPAGRQTFDLDIWDDWRRLPLGLGAVFAVICGIPITIAGMAQVWWVGWIAKLIPVGGGDVAFELGFIVTALVYLPARWVEKRLTGR